MSLSRVTRRGVATASTVGVPVTLGAATAPSASASVASSSRGSTATPGYDEVTGIGALDIAALNSVIAGS